MKKKDKKLVFAFTTLLIIILATFAARNYYYETKYISKKIEVEGLFAKAFVDENIGAAPLDVNFSSLLFNFEGTPTYHWDFGDGNTSNETNPTHNYTEEGEYTCNLTVTDITGENVTTSVKILVKANRAPTVVALVLPIGSARPYVPGLIRLKDLMIISLLKTSSPLTKREGWITAEAQPSDPEGDEIVLYEWKLIHPDITNPFTRKQEWPESTFSDKNLTTITFPQLYTYRTGNYNVKLTVTDAAGNTASDVKDFSIRVSNLEARRADRERKWEDFWQTKFAYLPDPLPEKIPEAMWNILGPIQTSMDTIVDRLPESIRNIILPLYNAGWEKQEKTYRKPNYNPPNAPSDPYPEDGATDVDVNADLSWNCSDPDGDDIIYDVYFGQSTPPPLVRLGQKSTNYTLVKMQPGTTYYWNIVAKDKPISGESKETLGPLWSFTTEIV